MNTQEGERERCGFGVRKETLTERKTERETEFMYVLEKKGFSARETPLIFKMGRCKWVMSHKWVMSQMNECDMTHSYVTSPIHM